jgi:hypothetical protein
LSVAAICSTPAPTIGPATLQATALFGAVMPHKPSTIEWANSIAQAYRLATVDANFLLATHNNFPI